MFIITGMYIAFKTKSVWQRQNALIPVLHVNDDEYIEQMDGPSYEALLNRVDVSNYDGSNW